mgnify:CR=1 FL=1
MKTEVLIVKGMSCSHCERAINESVAELNGVKEVKASVDTNTVTVTFDDSLVTLLKIKEAIEEEGYDIVD